MSQALRTSSSSPASSASVLRKAFEENSSPELLATLFPPLQRYVPILQTVSPQQALWLLLDCRQAFYGGAAGGGKSAALLMAALQYVDTPGYAALILRRTYPQLTQPGMLIPLSKLWLGGTGAKFKEDDREWRFPSGAVIKFGHVDDENAVFNYQGGAYQFVGFDELTQFTPAMYEYIAFSRARRELALERAGIPIRIRATANPGGVGHAWVKAKFVEEKTRDPDVPFIPAKVADNPGLDVDDYTESLSYLGDVLRAQLLEGDWGAFEGAAYPMFTEHDHVLDAIDIPDGWETFESLDWGSTNPTSVLAWAIDYDGNAIVFDELYVEEPQPHLPDDVVPMLLEKRASWHRPGASVICHADPSVFAAGQMTKWGRPPSVADEFMRLDAPLYPAVNDRVAGYVRLGQLFKVDKERPFPDWHPRSGELGAPRAFIFRRCTHLIEQVQGAPLEVIGEPHPGEAVSRKWEGPYGHSHAAGRYGAMSWPGPSVEKPKPDLLAPPDPPDELRRRARDRVEEQRNKPAVRRRGWRNT